MFYSFRNRGLSMKEDEMLGSHPTEQAAQAEANFYMTQTGNEAYVLDAETAVRLEMVKEGAQ